MQNINKTIFVSLIIKFISVGVVCTLDELVDRLRNDLDMNGRLNCIRDYQLEKQSDMAMRSKMVKAQWKGDCAFEADGAKWLDPFLNFYATSKKLVDAEGKSYSQNRPHEADMCEIVRSMIGNQLFNGAFIDLNMSLDEAILMQLQCPNGMSGSTRVCAATGGSYDEREKWFIFLTPKGLNVSNQINFKCTNQGLKEIFDKVNAQPGGKNTKRFQ